MSSSCDPQLIAGSARVRTVSAVVDMRARTGTWTTVLIGQADSAVRSALEVSALSGLAQPCRAEVFEDLGWACGATVVSG